MEAKMRVDFRLVEFVRHLHEFHSDDIYGFVATGEARGPR
jgi:hypothetical protein